MIKRASLNDYSARNPLNARIAENMIDVTLMQEGFDTFENKACFCFSKAYEICKQIIEESPVSIWKVPDYYNDATYIYAKGDLATIMKAITISIVLILAEHFDEKWQQENQKFLDKMRDGLNNLQLSEEKKQDVFSQNLLHAFGAKSACINAFETLRRGTGIDYVIPFEEFSNQKNNYIGNTGPDKEESLSREEMKKIIEDTIKDSFDKHKKEIDEEESISNEEIKKAWEQALYQAKKELESKIPRLVYDEKNEGLTIITGANSNYYEQNESMEDVIKTTVKRYLDENTASDEDIDEIFSEVYGKELVDQVNKEMPSSNIQNKDVQQKQDNKSQLTNAFDNLQKQLDEANKTIEEQEATIKDLKDTIIRYQKRGLPPAKRKGIALGLTPLQADIFGDYLADKLGIVFDNKKKELSLILNCLFGQGLSSLANKMHLINGAVEDRLYVASIFGQSSPEIAKEICSDWDEDTHAPWEEEVEYDDENEEGSD